MDSGFQKPGASQRYLWKVLIGMVALIRDVSMDSLSEEVMMMDPCLIREHLIKGRFFRETWYSIMFSVHDLYGVWHTYARSIMEFTEYAPSKRSAFSRCAYG